MELEYKIKCKLTIAFRLLNKLMSLPPFLFNIVFAIYKRFDFVLIVVNGKPNLTFNQVFRYLANEFTSRKIWQ